MHVSDSHTWASLALSTVLAFTGTATISNSTFLASDGLYQVEAGTTVTLSGNVKFNDGLGDLTYVLGGTMTDFYWEKTTTDGINVLLSGSKAMSSGVFFTLVWEGEDHSVVLGDITVSDGVNDYYLPIAK